VTDEELRAMAMADEKVQSALSGALPSKIIVVPKRLVNVVL
jgi:leucyl-tRNA synthetase